MLRVVLICLTLTLMALTSAVFAAAPAGAPVVVTAEPNAAQSAQALLAQAVEYYKENKEKALAAFSRAGDFVKGELYVYVIDTHGEMLASGGSSSVLIGRNVSGMRDVMGKPFFREMIDTAKREGAGQVEYRWLNRADSKIERKVAYYQKVDERILAVGFYTPRASLEQAITLLDQAVDAVQASPDAAFAEFNDLNGRFIQDDLYVFVLSLKDSIFQAHGATPRLVGTDALALKDPTGKPIIEEMLAIARTKGAGDLTYKWRNPVTEKIETKHTFLRRVSDYIIGVGHYMR